MAIKGRRPFECMMGAVVWVLSVERVYCYSEQLERESGENTFGERAKERPAVG